MTEKDIQKMMDKLEISREEAIEMLQEDEQIDKMTVKEAYSDLTAEQRKVVKSATITGSKKKVAVKRERKIDLDKKLILDKIFHFMRTGNFVQMNGEPEQKNETEINFSFGKNSYTIKLIKHRPKKEGEKK